MRDKKVQVGNYQEMEQSERNSLYKGVCSYYRRGFKFMHFGHMSVVYDTREQCSTENRFYKHLKCWFQI